MEFTINTVDKNNKVEKKLGIIHYWPWNVMKIKCG
jgi:hypothetical protein